METSLIIHERIKQLCRERKLPISKLEKLVGLGNGTITKWGKSYIPSAEKVRAIAEYLDVTTDYLLGITDVRENTDELTDDAEFASLQRAYIKMSQADRSRMMTILRAGFEEAFKDEG